MKNRLLCGRFAALVGLLSLTAGGLGCGGRQFDVVRTASITLRAGDDLSQLSFAELTPLTLLDDVILRAQGVGRSDLRSVQLRRMTMTVLAPGSSQDFTFLPVVTVAMQTPVLPAQIVAAGGSAAVGPNLLVLEVQGGELLRYFASTDPQVSIQAPGGIAPQDMTLRVEMTLELDASSAKILVE